MSSVSEMGQRRATTGPPAVLLVGLWALAAYDMALALAMALAPRSFFTGVAPFGAFNAHYMRDIATFSGALGVASVIAVRRPSWRVPVLAVSALQFVLHTINHLADINSTHPRWNGYADFVSLALATALLIWLLGVAMHNGHRER